MIALISQPVGVTSQQCHNRQKYLTVATVKKTAYSFRHFITLRWQSLCDSTVNLPWLILESWASLVAQWDKSTSKCCGYNSFSTSHDNNVDSKSCSLVTVLSHFDNIRVTDAIRWKTYRFFHYLYSCFLGLESKQCDRSFDCWWTFILRRWISDCGHHARRYQRPKNFDQREPISNRFTTFSVQSKDSTTNSADGWHIASKYRARHHRDTVETSAWRSGQRQLQLHRQSIFLYLIFSCLYAKSFYWSNNSLLLVMREGFILYQITQSPIFSQIYNFSLVLIS